MPDSTDSTALPDSSAARHWLPAARSWAIGLLFVLLACGVLLVPLGATQDEALNLRAGDLAPFDIVASRSQTYVSEIQTQSAKASAETSIASVYDPPDTRIARQQVTAAQAAISFVNSVRADTLASELQKRQELTYLRDLSLSGELQIQLLHMEDSRWVAVQEEVTRVIEAAMSEPIREHQLAETRDRVPMMISVAVTVQEADLAAALAGQFIVPNSIFNESATQQARDAAIAAVHPVEQAFAQGQTIVPRGNVLTEHDLEAMTALDMLAPKQSPWETYLPPVVAVVLVAVTMTLYLLRSQPEFFGRTRHLLFITLLALAFLFSAQFVIPERVVLAFLFPTATLGMLIAVGLGAQLGLVTTTLFVVFIAIISNGRVDVTIYHLAGPIVAILALGKAERVNSFLLAGLATAAGNAAVILIFRLDDPAIDMLGLSTLLGASLANGAISGALTLMGLFLLGFVFDITTSLQLVELSRPNHPLLVGMLRAAPGTYQHSLHVANLAEQAAQRIGANTMLVRVGALFHDIGKTRHPEYFVENQIEGINPHEHLSPHASARIIIDHVRDGDEMAGRHRLPSAIRAAILEHHGTTVTMYQHEKEVEEADGDEAKVAIGDFTYPGPKPRSRETALLMLADGCEAKARADNPTTTTDIDDIVRYIINRRLRQGQLDECNLSLTDLNTVRESFVNTLKGFFHSRLQYPSAPEKEPTVEQLGAPEQSALPASE